jgi:hypothetical protein
VPPAVALLNYISCGILLRIFAKLGHFAGFSPHIVNFVGRISEAAMKGVGDIIFHNFGAQWNGTPSHCDFSPGLFYILFAVRISEVAMGGGRGWGGRGTLYFKAGGEAIFHGKGSGGTQIIRQHRDSGILYNILYSL